MPAVLLDTCAAIWLMSGDRLSPASLKAIDQAKSENAGIFVSPISAWEIAMLVSRGRLLLTLSPRAWFAALLAQPGIRLATLAPETLIDSVSLPGTPPNDPSDRIIAATGRAHNFRVVTRDAKLIAYAAEGHLVAIAC